MFTFGYEYRGSKHAGLLADGALSSPLHAAMVVGDTLRFSDQVTIYTNGDHALKLKMMAEIKDPAVAYEEREIVRITRKDDGLMLEMEDRSDDVEFLVHQPATKVDLKLADQLGLKYDERGDIQNTPPFFQTNVPGVFVAGDCASPFKIIPMALFMGANAGAGIARSLAADNLGPRLQPTSIGDRYEASREREASEETLLENARYIS